MKILPGFAALALVLTAALPLQAGAAEWPAKPIHFLVPFPAGGPTDMLSRRLAERLGDSLGQPVIVENVAGAMGSIGLARLARAQPDGYTIGLSAHSSHAIAPHEVATLPYDPRTAFQPIGGTVIFSYVLVANPAQPAKTITELVERSRQTSGGLTFGSSGLGGGNHLAGELLRIKTGANLLHVPYKGVAPAAADVMAGHIGFMFDVVASAIPQIRAGKMRAIAVTGDARSPLLPDVPTVAETIPGFEGIGWFAIFGPRGMPPAVTGRLNAEMDRIYRETAFASFLEDAGYTPEFGPPERLGQRVQHDYRFWGEVIAAAGVKSE